MGKVDARELAQAGFRYLGRSYSDMDCQGFVERCLADCGNHTDLGGSNSWFRECLKNGWVGTPEDCRKEFGNVPVGAFLFILEAVSSGTPAKFRNDGIGDATHMGIVTGNDKGAIHSSKSRGGVCESEFHGKTVKNGGWNRVGLWMTEVDYHVDAGQSGSDSGLSHGGTSGGASDDSGLSGGSSGGTGGGSSDSGTSGGTGGTLSDEPPELCRVSVPDGTNVISRKGPGKHYGMSLAGRIPNGATVEIIKRVDKSVGEWCRIKWTDSKHATWYCWVAGEFLEPINNTEESGAEWTNESEQGKTETPLCTVHIPGLTECQVNALMALYPGSWRSS